MISRLHVENFKCLRDVTVDLGPFTVLIGSNDSGKSSILDAIRVIGGTTRVTIAESLVLEEESRDDPFDEVVWMRDTGLAMTLSVTGRTENGADSTFEYALKLRRPAPLFVIDEHLTLGSDHAINTINQPAQSTSLTLLARQQPAQAHRIRPVLAALGSSRKYRLDPHALRATNPFKAQPVLTSAGDNLPEALDALITGPRRDAIVELEKALHNAVPTLSGVNLRTLNLPGGVGKEIHFNLSGTDVTVRPPNVSEGALLLTAFLVLAYGESQNILLIEEPENGLHPTRLQTVIELLRAMSTGAVGNRPRQVILTTHSPLLLNYVKPEEVRIVRRDPEHGSSVTPMTAVPNLDKLLQEFAVGELWYLLTEEGLLKGERP